MTALDWKVNVRPWIVAAKTLMPHRSLTFGATESRRVAALPVIALGLAAAAVAGAGSAYAYVTVHGTGTGSATAAAGYPNTIKLTTSAATTTTLLRPGGTGDVAVKITNSNAFGVTLGAIN